MDRQQAARALEEDLKGLRGVRGAKVDYTGAGVKSVTVLVVPERTNRETIVDVRKATATRLGIEIEPARIQVLRSSESAESGQRRKLTSVLTERTKEHFISRVTLELAGDVLVGESHAPRGPRFEHRSMARATLEGVGGLIDFPTELNRVYVINEGDERIAMVVISSGTDMYVGSAVVRADEFDAIARATLDAINRFVMRPSADSAQPEPAERETA